MKIPHEPCTVTLTQALLQKCYFVTAIFYYIETIYFPLLLLIVRMEMDWNLKELAFR